VTEAATALTLGLVAASQPGPFQAFLLARTMRDGLRRSLPLVLAPLLSDGPVALLAIVVLSRAPAGWLRVLSAVGGVVALALAWEAGRTLRGELRARAAGTPPPPPPQDGDALRGGVIRAVLVNLTSPGPWSFWALVLGPLTVQAFRASPWSGVATVAAFYLALVGGMTALVLAFATARRLGTRVRLGLQAASVIGLAGFGVLLVGRAALG
jgi:threonine/homoserine/homoserine lactone efflux protein